MQLLLSSHALLQQHPHATPCHGHGVMQPMERMWELTASCGRSLTLRRRIVFPGWRLGGRQGTHFDMPFLLCGMHSPQSSVMAAKGSIPKGVEQPLPKGSSQSPRAPKWAVWATQEKRSNRSLSQTSWAEKIQRMTWGFLQPYVSGHDMHLVGWSSFE